MVACNGQIYNYRKLRAGLVREHGTCFATNGDIEVLAAVLHYRGLDGLRDLHGMCAFAACDAQERVLHAGRDPFGIKPLSCHAVRDLTPPSIVDRPKLGFPTPTAHWLRGELAG